MRTSTPLLFSALFAGAMAPVQAANFQDSAQVMSSTPVYESVNKPQRECWEEQVSTSEVRSDGRSYGGAIIGGLVGGLLGNQVGKGNGRSVATAVGAATGAIVGDNIDNDGHQGRTASQPRTEQRCRNVDNWTRQLTGYNVTYRYQGHDYNAFLPYDPGQTVRVNVNVSLAER